MKRRFVLSQVERVQTAKGRQQTGLYSIEGIRLLERAVRANLSFTAVIISERLARSTSDRESAVLHHLIQGGTTPVTIPDLEMARLTHGRSLGEIIALLPIPRPISLTTLPEKPLLLTAVNITDPGNVGALIRTAHASGCTGFVSVGQSDPFHPRAVRTSMGSLFKMATLHYATIESFLADLAGQNIVTVGTVVGQARPLTQMVFPQEGLALMMGNEFWGLPDSLANQLDYNISLPMADGIDSFSVNAAAAIILYEINRQWR